jgi:hypothetical protein
MKASDKKAWDPTLNAIEDLAAPGRGEDNPRERGLRAQARGLMALAKAWRAATRAGFEALEKRPHARAMAEMALEGLTPTSRRDALSEAVEEALSGGADSAKILPWLAQLGAQPTRRLDAKALRHELDCEPEEVALVVAAECGAWSSLATAHAIAGDPSGLVALEELGWAELDRQRVYNKLAEQDLQPQEWAHWAFGHPWVALKLGAARALLRESADGAGASRACEELALGWDVQGGRAKQELGDMLGVRAVSMRLQGVLPSLRQSGHVPGAGLVDACVIFIAEALAKGEPWGPEWGPLMQEVCPWMGQLDARVGEKALELYARDFSESLCRKKRYSLEGESAQTARFDEFEGLGIHGPGLRVEPEAWAAAARVFASARESLGSAALGGYLGSCMDALELELTARASGSKPPKAAPLRM